MTHSKTTTDPQKVDHNEDPITGEHGSHPAGAGLGAAAGGAAAGAAAGAVAGPVGAVAGAVIGGVAGGLAGKAVAEKIDPTVELAYWKDNHADRDYITDGKTFDDYKPAYEHGIDARTRYDHDDFEAVDEYLQREWDERGNTTMSYTHARPAIRDAYVRTGAVARGDVSSTGTRKQPR